MGDTTRKSQRQIGPSRGRLLLRVDDSLESWEVLKNWRCGLPYASLCFVHETRLDPPPGRERSGGVACVSLELGRRAAPQGPGVQGGSRAIVSTSRGSSSGVQAAGVRGSGEVQARPRAGSGGASQTKELSSRIRQAGDNEAELSSLTRKATPARGSKTLGRHISAARRP